MPLVVKILIGAVVLWLVFMLLVAYILFVLHLKKRKPDTWARTDKGDTPDQTAMYQAGKIWSEENASCIENYLRPLSFAEKGSGFDRNL